MPLIRLVCALLIGVLLTACSQPTVPKDSNTTIIALRHADRDGEHLNSKGRARANALPAAVSDYQIEAIYAPDIARNIATAQPLSDALNLPITLIASETAGARMTRDYPNGTVVWVGNKNNLVTLWEDLDAANPAPLEYGDLFVVKMQGRAAPTVTRLSVPAGS